MSSLDNLSLNLATVGPQFGFTETLDAALKHGFETISPWRHHYEDIGLRTAVAELRSRGISVDSVCRISGFGPAEGALQWSKAMDEAKAMIEEAAELGARAVVFPGGGVGNAGSGIDAARARIAEGLTQIVPFARGAGILVLVEPLHPMVAADRGAISTLGSAFELCEQLGEGVGVMVDSYNVWWDPTLQSQMEKGSRWVSGFQVSDWLMTTPHTAFDRGMVGDGVIDFAAFRQLVDQTGYAGPIEVEVFSEKDWWTRGLDEVLSTARARVIQHLGVPK